MAFCLLQLARPELETLAASRVPEHLVSRLEPGALPPAFVATRSLRLGDDGQPAPWSTTFLIVRQSDQRIVGGCGFKTSPHNGRVEVGYGVAPTAQGQGAATAALKLLLTHAFAAGATEVLAEVTPDNQASLHVVQKAGFQQAGSRLDNENELVIMWLKRCTS